MTAAHYKGGHHPGNDLGLHYTALPPIVASCPYSDQLLVTRKFWSPGANRPSQANPPDVEIQTQPERPRSDYPTRAPGPRRAAHRAGRLPDDDIGREFDFFRAGSAADAVDQEIGGACPDLIGRDVDGAQRRVELRDDLEIGETRDRHILRDAETEHVALAERTDGERVRRAIDRGQIRVRGEQCPRRAAALDDGLRRHLRDMPRGGRDAAIIEAVEDPRQPRRDPVIEAGRGGDDAEVAMPEIDQIASEVEGADPVVEADAGMRVLPVELVGIDVRKLA